MGWAIKQLSPVTGLLILGIRMWPIVHLERQCLEKEEEQMDGQEPQKAINLDLQLLSLMLVRLGIQTFFVLFVTGYMSGTSKFQILFPLDLSIGCDVTNIVAVVKYFLNNFWVANLQVLLLLLHLQIAVMTVHWVFNDFLPMDWFVVNLFMGSVTLWWNKPID